MIAVPPQEPGYHQAPEGNRTAQQQFDTSLLDHQWKQGRRRHACLDRVDELRDGHPRDLQFLAKEGHSADGPADDVHVQRQGYRGNEER